ncbi:MAG TPA: DUF6295 family protein [Candidatus Bathyarchaeia archaeon]|nr:DUF6295 family protein [Candidatus Bathyarchaeia archaeon]
MCTGIVETVEVIGSSGKARNGSWIKLEQVHVSYDHPTDAPQEHALNIDFVSEKNDPGARIAVELSSESARKLVDAINTALSRGSRIVS